MPLEIDLTEIGCYDVLERIAEGGMGTVYKARSQSTGDVVAVKVLTSAVRNPTILRRFEQEFRAASMVDHPNVVKGIEYGLHEGTPYLVMEYVDGESLGQRVERDGAVPEPEAVRIIGEVAEGLAHAHSLGLIHRDVKPDNVLLGRDGAVKLTDLGLVKDAEADMNLTRTGRGLGTPHYMAPEQFRNAKHVDTRSDIYSLGATLYTMVTGKIPFDGLRPLDCWMKKANNEFARPRRVNPSLSEAMDYAIRRAMSGEPENRPATCREFMDDLRGGPAAPNAEAASEMKWYLVYRDPEGQTHTVKGTTEAVRKNLRDQFWGDPHHVRAARSKQGPFKPLKQFAEFRDLLVEPAPMKATLSDSRTPTPSFDHYLAPRPTDHDEVDVGRAGRPAAPGAGVTGRLDPAPSTRHLAQGPTAPSAPATQAAPAPEKPAASPLPDLDLRPHTGSGVDWATLTLAVLLALASALVGFMYLWG